VLAGRRAIGGGAEIGVAVRAGRLAAKLVVHGFSRRRSGCCHRRRPVGSPRRYGRREEKGGAVQHRPRVIVAVLKGDADADYERDRYRIGTSAPRSDLRPAA
jgi:hypothetical protein